MTEEFHGRVCTSNNQSFLEESEIYNPHWQFRDWGWIYIDETVIMQLLKGTAARELKTILFHCQPHSTVMEICLKNCSLNIVITSKVCISDHWITVMCKQSFGSYNRMLTFKEKRRFKCVALILILMTGDRPSRN